MTLVDAAAATLAICYGDKSATVVTVVIYDTVADLRCAVAFEDFEQDCCAQAKGQAHHQAGTKDIEEASKNGENRRALQLNVLAKSLKPNTQRQVRKSTRPA